MTRVRCCSCYIQTTTDCYSVNACSRVAPTTRSHDSASVLNLGVSATHRAALLTTVQLGHSAIQQVLYGLLPHMIALRMVSRLLWLQPKEQRRNMKRLHYISNVTTAIRFLDSRNVSPMWKHFCGSGRKHFCGSGRKHFCGSGRNSSV